MSQAPSHPKHCQCKACIARRTDAYIEKIDGYAKTGVIPRSVDQTVMVREYTVKPHFRRNGRHLTNDSVVRANVESYIAKLLKRRGFKEVKS